MLSNTMLGCDTVHLTLPKEKSGKTDLLAEIPPLLEHIRYWGYEDSEAEGKTGMLKNLKVTVNEKSVKVMGSIAAYLHGNNLQLANRNQVKEAIMKLSDELHLPMYDSIVTRVDTTGNIITDLVPAAYYRFLGSMKGYDRLEQNNGIEYRRKQGGLLFYDKMHERVLKTGTIPENMQKINMLRYEDRSLKSLNKLFKLDIVKASNLWKENFCDDLCNKWRDDYFKIRKQRLPSFSPKALSCIKDFRKQLLITGINAAGGEAAAANMLQHAKKLGLFKNRVKEQRFRDELESICTTPNLTYESDAIKELDAKIIQLAKHGM